MNKIYRVVFNHATQSWTAVAEIARAQGKGSRSIVGSIDNQNGVTGKLLRFSLIMSGIILSSHSFAATGADVSIDGNSHYCFYDQGTNSILCGDGNTKNTLTTVIPGFGAITQGGSNTVTMGTAATTLGNNAVAVGNASTANGVNSIAVGRNTEALNNDDVAIGTQAGVGRGDKGSTYAAGTAFAAGTYYSGGAAATVGSIATNSGISIGQNSGTNSTGVNNTMIGKSAGTQLFGDNTVSIGTNANNYLANGFSNGQVNTNNNTVDALSGNTKAANAVNRSRKSVAIGNNAMTYDDSNIAIGDGAKSLGASSIAMGTGARAGMAYATVGGVTRGDKGSIAIGNNSVAPLEGDLSIGVNAGSRVNQNTTTTSNMQTTKNISVGYEVGGNVYGYTNSVFGTSSGGNIGTAAAPNYANVAIGDQVGNSIRGNNNVNIGYQGGSRIMSNSNTSIGSRSGSDVNGANNVTTGTFAGTFVSGNANWAAGKDSGTYLGVLSNASRLDITTGNFVASDGTVLTKRNATNNVAAGEFTGRYVGGSKNIAFGQNAGEYVGHKGTEWGAVSNNNIAMGEQSGRFIEGSHNFASGYQAGSGTAINATLVRDKSISQGYQATAYTNDSIAMGTGAIAGVQSANGAGKVNAIAIGKGAQATGNQSISVGTGNVVSGDNSGAFGDPSYISGTGTYALGNDNGTADAPIAADNAFIVGSNNTMDAFSDNSGILGSKNTLSDNASGTYVIGNQNTVETNDTFVLGNNVTKTHAQSVFLGMSSGYTEQGDSTDGVGTVSDATVGGITYAGSSFAGQKVAGVVSVGDVDAERRIQNVSAGLISATSTDAINGSQLYAVASTLGNQVENTYFHTNTGTNAGTGNATTNLGKITDAAGATGTGAVTAGMKTVASGGDSVAIGSSAQATDRNAVALGNSAKASSGEAAVAIGALAQAAGERSAALSAYSKALGSHDIAIGDQSVASGTYSVAIGSTSKASALSATALGDSTIANVANSVALGAYSTTIAAKGTTTDGNGIVSDATVGGITYAGKSFAGQNAQTLGVVSVGKVGEERRIQNVAAGLISATSTDAINGSQLYAVASTLGNQVENTYFHTNTGTNAGTGNATTNLGKITDAAGATGTNAVTAGKYAIAAGANAVAVGQSATANAAQVTSVGYNAGQGSTNAANSTFIGTGAGAGSNGTAVGTQLTTAYNTYVGSNAGNGATGVQNTAVGGNNAGAGVTGDANAAFGHASLYNTKGNLNTGLGAYAGQNSTGNSNTSVGDNAGRKVTGNNNTALGSNAGTETKGSDNVAIGVDAGQSITAAETVSIGKGAKANNYKAVALGSGAVTDVSVDTKEATVNGITYGNFAGSESIATVSVGSKDNERTITNVAAGRISATSTDAINGSQLYMVADKLGTLNTEIANTYFHVNNGSNKDTGDATTNLGRITDAAGAKNVGAVTAGMNAVAETSQSIAIGQGAKAGAADRTGSSNWANIIDPRTKKPFTSEAELLAYYETVKTNPGNTVTRALIGKINNIAIGAGAVAEGGRNISIGENAGVGTADNWNIQNVNIGTEAGQNSKKDYSVAIGYRAGALTKAQQVEQLNPKAVLDAARHPSILIGKQAGEGTVAYGTVAMGAEAGKDISDVHSIHNIAIGRNAGQGVSSNDGRNATFGGFGSGANTMMGASAGKGLSGDGNVAIGNKTGEGTTGDNNIMMGHLAGASSSSDRSIIMGPQTANNNGVNDRNVLIGNFVNGSAGANKSVARAVGIGSNTVATGNSSIALGTAAEATATNSIAQGWFANASKVNAIAQGSYSKASGENAISIGAGSLFFPNTASGEKSIALGYANDVTGESAIAIGTQNKVSGANAGAIGDPSIVAGAGSYTLGNDNAVGSTSTNVGAFGNNNQIGATATYDANGKLLLASGLTDTAAVENSRAVGNKNYINTSDTYVLGSGVGTKDDGTVLGTVKNSVYLGNDSTVAKGAAVGTKNLDKEGVAGTTTTAGDTGTVETATVNGVTYGSFAGKTAAGAVSVGSAGAERRVMNVAAGEISATSTDAINGSQLYLVANGLTDQMPVIYTDTDGNKVYKQPDGTFVDADGNKVDAGDVIASMNDGDNIANTPKTLANVAGSLTPTYNKGDMTIGTDGKPTDTAAGGPTILQTGPKAEDAAKIYNNAATVGDVLNAGWNLQGNGSAQDFVKPYDTVNFADGTGTTVDVTTDDGKTSTIKVNVDAQSTVESAQTPVVYTNKDGDKLIKGDDGKFYPADSVKIGDNYYPAGTTEDENGNPVDANGDTVTALTPTGTGDIIASMNNGDNSTTAPMTLTNIASNLPNTYNKDAYNTAGEPVTTSQALPDNLNVNNAATVGDILNAGWNLQGNGVAKDFVKPYDTVNFVNGNATTATVETAADGKSSTVKYDVQVDGSTIKVVDGKLTAAADSNTVTGVTAGDNITVTSTTDASGNPTYTVATKKDVTFDSVTINNGPTINADGINMNGDKITNVADGDISPTSKDAVNGSQLYSAVNNINSNIAASKEEVTSNDKSVTVTTTKNASGSNVFDLSVNTDGTTITKNANGVLTVNTTPLTNNTDGSVNTPAAPNAIATAGDVANAINNSGFNLTAQGSNGSLVKPGSTVDMNNTDGNIVISKSASDNKVTYNLAKDIKVDSVTTGNTVVNNSGVTINNADPAKTVSLTENGLNNGGNRITNVAPGKDGTDAVNVNQLNQVNNNVVNLNDKVNRVDRDLRGGIAGANAAAALPQAYIPGKSMVAAAAGTYRGQSALAVGYSRISDNGKIILKLQGNTNTRGDIGGAIGVGYQW
ncbi:YadA-like family protein [[Pasteurella] aerogenes]|nr:YadA-like family protein [[Pasteurella] aerogenes]